MKKPLLTVLLAAYTILLPSAVHAQGEENVWAFGRNAGLDFNQPVPTAIRTAIDVQEDGASVCDASGRLLFYTNGEFIWNRNHLIMNNGDVNVHTNSSSQAAAIVPVPESSTRYYVFSLESLCGSSCRGRLYYSVVDMSLRNGLGDVVTGQRAILLDQNLTEKMTAVAGDNCNIWLVVRSHNSHEYKAYEITANGLNTTPVISPVGILGFAGAYGYGTMKFSPDRRKMIACNRDDYRGLEIYDFDPATGLLSNPYAIDPNEHYQGGCFSPDNSKIYAATSYNAPSFLYQFDLDQPTPAAVTASKTLLYTHPSSNFGSIKAGPDGKLYFSRNDTDSLHVINQPNEQGLACQVVLNAIPLVPGTRATHGFPNDIPVWRRDTTFSLHHISLCPGESKVLEINLNGENILWDDSSTAPQRAVSQAGLYVVSYMHGCNYFRDSFHVTMTSYPLLSIPEAYSCPDQFQGEATVVPASGDTTLFTFTWAANDGHILRTSQGRDGDTFHGLLPGIYRLMISSSSGCDTIIPFTIHPFHKQTASFTADSVLCTQALAEFVNKTSDSLVLSWEWYAGDDIGKGNEKHFSHVYTTPGMYPATLIAHTLHCSDTAIQWIRITSLTLSLESDADMIDAGNRFTLTTHADNRYAVSYWRPAHLFADQHADQQELTADSSRTYFVYAISEDGCADSAALRVLVNPHIFIPSAFSPNGDGRNDYFGIRTGGDAVRIRTFNVFDRWGKLIWSTTGINDNKGWDGFHKGHPVEMGIYFYQIEIETLTGEVMKKNGEVTLVR